jgi:hypothetical protein
VSKTVAALARKLFKRDEEEELINVTVSILDEVDEEIALIEESLLTILKTGSWGAWEGARQTAQEFDDLRVVHGPNAGLVSGIAIDASSDNYMLTVMLNNNVTLSVCNVSGRDIEIGEVVSVVRRTDQYFGVARRWVA